MGTREDRGGIRRRLQVSTTLGPGVYRGQVATARLAQLLGHVPFRLLIGKGLEAGAAKGAPATITHS
jgi:hypothetical protein